MFNARLLKRSFKNACHGLVYTFRYEQNFRIEIVIAILVLFATFYFPLSLAQRIVILLLVFSVLILEIVNSILERLIDFLKPRIDQSARIIKDMAAAALLLAAIVSVVIGVMIFYPYIRQLFL
ncbi:diacylglycerol kinase family protein [bacterium]|nr:diacylglycerol kinase family protein [bacterium]